MQFIKKHLKQFIIFTIGLVAIIIVTIIIVVLLENSEKSQDEKNALTNRAKELIQSNYLFSYIYQGDVAISDGSIIVDDVTYNYIADENFKDINSWKDITALIKNTFVADKHDIYYEKIENGHQYFENDETLYVAKTDAICQNLPSLNLSSVSILTVEDDKMLINWNSQIIYAYQENDNWYLGTDNFYCMDNYIK